jgi:hypothetical protein
LYLFDEVLNLFLGTFLVENLVHQDDDLLFKLVLELSVGDLGDAASFGFTIGLSQFLKLVIMFVLRITALGF